MAQLIQIRQRIKAIDTIKKITHAMRLIAMSSHSRLRSKEEILKQYMTTSIDLLNAITPSTSLAHKTPLDMNTNATHLVILIGSQRGLCGSFNSILLHYFNEQVTQFLTFTPKIEVIVVGKQIAKELKPNDHFTTIKIYDELSNHTLGAIALTISSLIEKQQPSYSSTISNHLKTFFVQKPQTIRLFPFTLDNHKEIDTSEYLWEESPENLLNRLQYQTIQAHLHYLLFQSLLAEQAARFLSMDNATRNAQNLLTESHLQYNKLRQAKITKEITELSGSF